MDFQDITRRKVITFLAFEFILAGTLLIMGADMGFALIISGVVALALMWIWYLHRTWVPIPLRPLFGWALDGEHGLNDTQSLEQHHADKPSGTWQEALRSRVNLTPIEAACLIANVPKSEDSDLVDAYEREIWDAVLRGYIYSSFSVPTPSVAKLMKRDGVHEYQENIRRKRQERLDDGYTVSRKSIAEYYDELGNKKAVSALLGEEAERPIAESPAPQSPQNTESKKQP